MPDCEPRDVVRVPFPYTNRPVQQRRPALMVARHTGEGMPSLHWVLMITSAAPPPRPADGPITDQDAAGLPVPSMVRPVKVATIEAVQAETISSLCAADRERVVALLKTVLPT